MMTLENILNVVFIKMDKYPKVWMKIFVDELGCLAQGI